MADFLCDNSQLLGNPLSQIAHMLFSSLTTEIYMLCCLRFVLRPRQPHSLTHPPPYRLLPSQREPERQ